LLLADTDGAAVPPDVTLGETVTKPPAGAAEQLDLIRAQPDLFLELPEHGLLRRLVGVYPALRKLPGILADTPAPE